MVFLLISVCLDLYGIARGNTHENIYLLRAGPSQLVRESMTEARLVKMYIFRQINAIVVGVVTISKNGSRPPNNEHKRHHLCSEMSDRYWKKQVKKDMKPRSKKVYEFSSPINLSIPIEQTEEEKAKFEEITAKLLRSKKATINVGGHIHSVLWETIEKIPHSRLAISGVDNNLLLILACYRL